MASLAKWSVRYARRDIRNAFSKWRQNISLWRKFWGSYKQYRELGAFGDDDLLPHLYPCLDDATAETIIEPVYFYQDAWAFEKIVQEAPVEHVDVGSHHKFVALLSKVLRLTMVDIRPLSLPMETIRFRAGTILHMPFEDGSVMSLSSICVVEHIGLGRYGDPLDPHGTIKAVDELKRILAPGGNMYVSLPLDDKDRTYFNAHRAFTEKSVIKMFAPLEIIERRYIYGDEFGNSQKSGFGTGCYHFRKPL